MTTASVTTDINIGPFIIPSNAQNMIMNNYADRNQLKIELLIPEPMKSNSLSTLQWINEERKIKIVILTSIYQLPQSKKRLMKFIELMKNIEFHFAIEGINGKGKNFLLKQNEEVKIFSKSNIIDSSMSTWLALNNLTHKSN